MHGYANFVDAENGPLAPCLKGEKLHHNEKMSIFKVRDTFTMMKPWLKTFYDHLRCS